MLESVNANRVAMVCAAIASKRPVHMSGIGGVGMAGLALNLQAAGISVSGCDLQRNLFFDGLASSGMSVHLGHDAQFIAPPVAWVIRSAAVREHQPDIAYAREHDIPVFTRGEVLAALVNASHASVAVAGTHGKTTTSTLTAQLLQSLDPSWCIGGISATLPMPGGIGSGPFVVEADESDGSLALYAPTIGLITNIDFDHMEHFDSLESFEASFISFWEQTRECLICCADDARAASMAQQFQHGCCRLLRYGFSPRAEVRGQWDNGSFRISFPGGECFTCNIPQALPGHHNALNLLGALTICYAMDVPPHDWSATIPLLRMPARRFETLVECGGIRVISDYAHHPAEIAALIQTSLSLPYERVIAVFQPHRYSRTLALRNDFPKAFEGVDHLILTPVYAASEDPIVGGTSEDLLQAFAENTLPMGVELVTGLDEVAQWVLREVRAGDLVLVVGAGDIEKAGRMIADAIRSLNGT
jgi:UDP-N-acetylmuramate--alanine ligase